MGDSVMRGDPDDQLLSRSSMGLPPGEGGGGETEAENESVSLESLSSLFAQVLRGFVRDLAAMSADGEIGPGGSIPGAKPTKESIVSSLKVVPAASVQIDDICPICQDDLCEAGTGAGPSSSQGSVDPEPQQQPAASTKGKLAKLRSLISRLRRKKSSSSDSASSGGTSPDMRKIRKADPFDLRGYKESDLFTLPCSHIIHAQCLLPWLQTSSTCPMCRADLNSNHLPTIDPN